VEWTISYLSDKDIVVVTVSGMCDAVNTRPVLKALCEEATQRNCFQWLGDARMAVRAYSTIDYYQRPALYNELSINRAIRAAVVFSEVGRQERFYENVCRNAGFDVSVHADVDAAIGWLTDSCFRR
jgi:hypothetical protein